MEIVKILKVPCFVTWNGIDVIKSDNPFYGGRVGTYGKQRTEFWNSKYRSFICYWLESFWKNNWWKRELIFVEMLKNMLLIYKYLRAKISRSSLRCEYKIRS